MLLAKEPNESTLIWLVKVFLRIVVGLFFFGVLITSLFYFNQVYIPFKLTLVRKIFLIFLQILGIVIGSKIIKQLKLSKIETKYILLLAFILRLIWIVLIPTELEQDFYKMYQASLRFAKGDFGFMEDSFYFVMSPYQLGFVLYEGSLIKLFGESVFFLKLWNVVLSVATVYLTIKLGEKLFDQTTGKLAGWFMSLYLPNIAITSILTNQIIALFIFLLAILLFLKGEYWYPIVGILLFLGNLTRPLASVLLITLVLYFVFFIFPYQKQKLLSILLLLSIPLTMFICSKTTDFFLKKAEITQTSIATVNPYWKLALGLNLEKEGHWNIEDYQYVNNHDSQQAREVAAKELITERLTNVNQFPLLMWVKFKRMWNDFDTSISWATDFMANFSWQRFGLFMIQRIEYALIILGVLVTLFYLQPKKETWYLLLILIIGYVLIHQLVEIQTRYRYFIYPFFAVLSANGWVNQKSGLFEKNKVEIDID